MRDTNNNFRQKERLDWHCLQHENIKDCIKECTVQQVLQLFGKKYVMQIVRLLLIHDKLRFNEILEKLRGSPKTITSRLRDLEKLRLIKREVFNEIPMRVEYSITEIGTSLEDIFERLATWALSFKENKSSSKDLH